MGWEELRQEFNRLSLDAKRSIYGHAPTNVAKQNLGMADLQAVLEHIAQSDRIDEDMQAMAVPPGKIEANRLSSNVACLLKAGMEKADMVGRFFDGHPEPLFGDRVASSFRNRYRELRDGDTIPHPNDTFIALQQWAGWSEGATAAQQVAILAVIRLLLRTMRDL